MNELNIGKTLINKRKEKGITQDELANYIGVSKASVSKWETGQNYPDIIFLPKLASYFNITVDELISYKPQMTKEEIRKLYKHLSKEFTEKPFDEVMDEIREKIKEYYSCFPLIFHMGVLIINHYMLSKKDKHKMFIEEALRIFQRTKKESHDLKLCKQANLLAATCYMILSKPEKIIELLQGSTDPMIDESNLLSMGYKMTGDNYKAKEILQIGVYQNLLNLVQNLMNLFQNEAEDLKVSEIILNRIFKITDIFELEKLHPSTMFSIYILAAQKYAIENDRDNTLKMLLKYSNLACSDIYPLKLHGDEFLNKIDDFLEDLTLGTDAPRDEKTIKQSIIDSVEKNPAFLFLKDNFKYKNIIEKLNGLLKG